MNRVVDQFGDGVAVAAIAEIADAANNLGDAAAGRGPLFQIVTGTALAYGRRIFNRMFGNISKAGKELDKPRIVPNRRDKRLRGWRG